MQVSNFNSKGQQKALDLKAKLRQLTPYWFLSPYLVIFGVFGVFPILFMIYLSFHLWDPVSGLQGMEYVGLENYELALTDPTLWKSLANTFEMAIYSGVPQHLVALPLAFLLVNLGRNARQWLTSAYFLPYITSTIAVSMIFFFMFSPISGLFNKFLIRLSEWPMTAWAFAWVPGVMPIRWVQDNAMIQYSVSLVVFWKYTGWNIVIYSAGLATISNDLYEAAKIDGASTWQTFTKIALPLLRPFIFFGVTMTIIGNMNLFEEPWVLTRALRQAATDGMTISNYLYRVAWIFRDMGSAAAISWILFALIGVMTSVYFFMFGRKGLAGN